MLVPRSQKTEHICLAIRLMNYNEHLALMRMDSSAYLKLKPPTAHCVAIAKLQFECVKFPIRKYPITLIIRMDSLLQ